MHGVRQITEGRRTAEPPVGGDGSLGRNDSAHRVPGDHAGGADLGPLVAVGRLSALRLPPAMAQAAAAILPLAANLASAAAGRGAGP